MQLGGRRGVRHKSGWHCDFPEKQAILSVPATQHGTASVSEQPAPGSVGAFEDMGGGRSLTLTVLCRGPRPALFTFGVRDTMRQFGAILR